MRQTRDRKRRKAGRGPDDRSAKPREEGAYLGKSSSTRPWLPLGSKPRGLAPQGSQRRRPTEAPARATRASAKAAPSYPRLPHPRPQQRRISNPESPPSDAWDWLAPRLRHGAASETEDRTPAPPRPGCGSRRRLTQGRSTDARGVCFSLQGWPPLAPRRSSRDAPRGGRGPQRLTPSALRAARFTKFDPCGPHLF